MIGGGWGFLVGGGRLWCGEAVAGGYVDGRCGARADAFGAQASKEGIDVSGVCNGDGAGSAIVYLQAKPNFK